MGAVYVKAVEVVGEGDSVSCLTMNVVYISAFEFEVSSWYLQS